MMRSSPRNPRFTFPGNHAGSHAATCLLVAVIVSPSATVLAAVEGDTSLLTLVAAQHRDNRERVLSWTGKAEVRTLLEDAEGVMRSWKAHASFAFDRALDAKKWTWTYTEAQRREGGRLVPCPELLDQERDTTTLAVRDGFYRYAPGELLPKGSQWRHTLVILPPEKTAVAGLSTDFDPTWYFTLKGRDIEDQLSSYVGSANDPNMRMAVTREKGVLILEVHSGDTSRHFQFDLSRGGNLVLYRYRGQTLSERIDAEYAQHDSLWLPNTFTYVNTRKDPNGRNEVLTRSVRFAEQTLNKPIDPSEFTLASLNIAPGTRVSDHRLGLLYRYAGETNMTPDALADILTRSAPQTAVTPAPKGASTTAGSYTGQASTREGQAGPHATAEASAAPQSFMRSLRMYVVGAAALLAALLFCLLIARRKLRQRRQVKC